MAQVFQVPESTTEKIVVDLGVETFNDGDGLILTCHRWLERGAEEKAAEKLDLAERRSVRENFCGPLAPQKFWSWMSQALEAEWDAPEEPGEDRGEPFVGEPGSDENGLYTEFVLLEDQSPEDQKKVEREILRLSC